MQRKNSNSRSRKESKVRRLIKALVRVLSKARDLYVQSLSGCAGEVHSSVGWPASLQFSNIPESFSINSSSSNNDEVLYATNIRSLRLAGNIKGDDSLRRRHQSEPNVVGRSQIVTIGRIDEDKPCEFGEHIAVKTDSYPKFRSHSVSRSLILTTST